MQTVENMVKNTKITIFGLFVVAGIGGYERFLQTVEISVKLLKSRVSGFFGVAGICDLSFVEFRGASLRGTTGGGAEPRAAVDASGLRVVFGARGVPLHV